MSVVGNSKQQQHMEGYNNTNKKS